MSKEDKKKKIIEKFVVLAYLYGSLGKDQEMYDLFKELKDFLNSSES